MTKQLDNPQEAIILLVYNESLNVKEITRRLYNTNRNAHVSTWLRTLELKGWIKEDTDYWRYHKGAQKDKRFRYYFSMPQAIIDSVDKETPLKPSERKKLETLFSTLGFKKFVGQFADQRPVRDLDFLKWHIGLFAVYTNIFIDYAVNSTTLTLKQCKYIFLKYLKSNSMQRTIFNEYKKINRQLSREESNIKLDFDYQSMLLMFFDLGSGLRQKLVACYGDASLLRNLAFTGMSLCKTVDNLANDPTFRKKINYKKRIKYIS
ncbi:MAG: hypothetical protein JW771_01190 [Candidatus Thermoplasmatota archaeon]|nr:hypothetical protein [Candidatus Thermoplasmatota archaeon]